MRIGIDASCWQNTRGFGRFTRELLHALVRIDGKNTYHFYTDHATAQKSQFPDGIEVHFGHTRLSPMKAASAMGRRSFRDIMAMTRPVFQSQLDLFFFPAVYSYYPIFNKAKIVVTIHDMTPTCHAEAVFSQKKLKYFWELKQRMAIWQSHLILTVSEFSKRHIMQYCGIPQEKIRVIQEGPSKEFRVIEKNGAMGEILWTRNIPPDKRILLYVGGISPHKNLRTMVHAFSRLKKAAEFTDVKLVLVGDYQNDSFLSDYQGLKTEIHKLGLAQEIIFTGFIDDRELVYLYNAASLLVFPSLMEGFGLPAVEAMACGTPVVASRTGSLPEILGSAGRYFDPFSSEDMVKTIQQVLREKPIRDSMTQHGLERAKHYQWEKAAEKTLKHFEELVAS